MEVARTIGELHGLLDQTNGTLGLVPTMGCLHAGHQKLISASITNCDQTVVSIFVNPSQFGDQSDFVNYPRTLESDLEQTEQLGVDVVFTPNPDEVYPNGFATNVAIGELATVLEGAIRPGHFDAIATVVLKLINLTQPEHVFFGQKDAQQVAVIAQMMHDLNLPAQLNVVETVRAANNLALSTRNSRLTIDELAQAAEIYPSLLIAQEMISQGITDGDKLCIAVKQSLERASIGIDYVTIVDRLSFRSIDQIARGTTDPLLVAACRIGTIRLLDNLMLTPV